MTNVCRLLDDTLLRVKKSVPPNLIKWENIGLPKKQKKWRMLIICILVLLVLVVLFLVMMFLETWSGSTDFGASGLCPSQDVTQGEAFREITSNSGEPDSKLVCYC